MLAELLTPPKSDVKMVQVSNTEAKLTIRSIYLAVSCVLTPHTGPVPSAESLKSLETQPKSPVFRECCWPVSLGILIGLSG